MAATIISMAQQAAGHPPSRRGKGVYSPAPTKSAWALPSEHDRIGLPANSPGRQRAGGGSMSGSGRTTHRSWRQQAPPSPSDSSGDPHGEDAPSAVGLAAPPTSSSSRHHHQRMSRGADDSQQQQQSMGHGAVAVPRLRGVGDAPMTDREYPMPTSRRTSPLATTHSYRGDREYTAEIRELELAVARAESRATAAERKAGTLERRLTEAAHEQERQAAEVRLAHAKVREAGKALAAANDESARLRGEVGALETTIEGYQRQLEELTHHGRTSAGHHHPPLLQQHQGQTSPRWGGDGADGGHHGAGAAPASDHHRSGSAVTMNNNGQQQQQQYPERLTSTSPLQQQQQQRSPVVVSASVTREGVNLNHAEEVAENVALRTECDRLRHKILRYQQYHEEEQVRRRLEQQQQHEGSYSYAALPSFEQAVNETAPPRHSPSASPQQQQHEQLSVVRPRTDSPRRIQQQPSAAAVQPPQPRTFTTPTRTRSPRANPVEQPQPTVVISNTSLVGSQRGGGTSRRSSMDRREAPPNRQPHVVRHVFADRDGGGGGASPEERDRMHQPVPDYQQGHMPWSREGVV